MTATAAANLAENNLPDGWVWVKLGEVCEVEMGQSPPGNTYNEEGIGIPFFQGKTEFREVHPEIKKWCSSPTKIALPNDILLSVRAPIGPTNIANVKCCIGRGLCAIRYSQNFKFALHYLKLCEQRLDQLGTGTTFKAISGETIRSFPFPLPPLPEQHRIVAKLERLFARLARAEEHLRQSEAALERYRQSVLKTAFSATDAEGKMKEGWKWVKLGEVAEVKGGKRLPAGSDYAKSKTRFPYIRVVDFENMTVDLENLRYLDENVHSAIKNYTISDKDLYISIAGTIGRVGKIPSNLSGANLTENAAKITVIQGFDIDFLCFLMNGIGVQNQISELTRATTQPKLALFRIETLEIPMPPISEQTRIVSQISTALTRASALHTAIAQARAESARLRQSILREAFAGRLVPQEAGDEPAGVLLERIRREREKAGKNGRKR